MNIQELSSAIRNIRQVETDYSQADLANRMGLIGSQALIARLELGQCNPTVATLNKLAAALGKKVRIKFE